MLGQFPRRKIDLLMIIFRLSPNYVRAVLSGIYKNSINTENILFCKLCTKVVVVNHLKHGHNTAYVSLRWRRGPVLVVTPEASHQSGNLLRRAYTTLCICGWQSNPTPQYRWKARWSRNRCLSLGPNVTDQKWVTFGFSERRRICSSHGLSW